MSPTLIVLQFVIELREVCDEDLRVLLGQVDDMEVLALLIWLLQLEGEKVEEDVPHCDLL
jgi:hypothetical protein